MFLLKSVFLVLHVITAAAWFGMGLRLTGQARMLTSLERSGAQAIAQDGSRTLRLMGIFAALTLAFGTITILTGGGFGAYGAQYHTSLMLIAGAVALHYAMIQPAWSGLARNVDGENFESGRYQGRISAALGITHLIWLVVLVLMFWNTIRGGFMP